MPDEPVWTRDEPDSPCLRICVQHPQAGICIGCHRTAEEVSSWAAYTPERRAQLLEELPGRVALLRAAGVRRRGGRQRTQGASSHHRGDPESPSSGRK